MYDRLKIRKEEHSRRGETVSNARIRFSQIEDEVRDLKETKPWINETHREVLLEKIAEMRVWLDEIVERQKGTLPSEDPVFRSSEVENKVQKA